MNIHITNKALFEKLLNATILSIKIGSKMYGTSDKNSDTLVVELW